jgi:hypothetical protein
MVCILFVSLRRSYCLGRMAWNCRMTDEFGRVTKMRHFHRRTEENNEVKRPVRIFGVLAEIRTEYHLNASYCYYSRLWDCIFWGSLYGSDYHSAPYQGSEIKTQDC